MKLQLKRSKVTVADNSNATAWGLAKVPTDTQMEYGELAVNFAAEDPTIFFKDSDGIVREPYLKRNISKLPELI